MTLFFIVLGIVLTGIGIVVWLLLSERPAEEKTENISAANTLPSKETASDLLNRLGFENTQSPEAQKEKKKFSFLNFFKKKEDAGERVALQNNLVAPSNINLPTTGTLAVKAQASVPISAAPANSFADQEKNLHEEFIKLKDESEELKKKYTKQETLLNEKNQELDGLNKKITNELKTHSEFNKVKDILEKELKDEKVKCRQLQSDYNLKQTEADGFKKRVNQLEEKVTKLEKEIRAKEAEIYQLSKASLEAKSTGTTISPKPAPPPSLETMENREFIPVEGRHAPEIKEEGERDAAQPSEPEKGQTPKPVDELILPVEISINLEPVKTDAPNPKEEQFLPMAPDIIKPEPAMETNPPGPTETVLDLSNIHLENTKILKLHVPDEPPGKSKKESHPQPTFELDLSNIPIEDPDQKNKEEEKE